MRRLNQPLYSTALVLPIFFQLGLIANPPSLSPGPRNSPSSRNLKICRLLASQIGADLGYRKQSLLLHFSQLAFNTDITPPEKISTYPGSDDEQDGRNSQYARFRYQGVASSRLSKSRLCCADLDFRLHQRRRGIFLILFGFSGRHYVVAFCFGFLLLGFGSALGWTGAAVLMRPETPIAPPSHLASANRCSKNISVHQRLVGVLKDHSGDDREAVAIRRTLLALPMPLARRQIIHGGGSTLSIDLSTARHAPKKTLRCSGFQSRATLPKG